MGRLIEDLAEEEEKKLLYGSPVKSIDIGKVIEARIGRRTIYH